MNIIHTLAMEYPKMYSLGEATNRLNLDMNLIQSKGYIILSTEHLGDNTFKIEYRAGEMVQEHDEIITGLTETSTGILQEHSE